MIKYRSPFRWQGRIEFDYELKENPWGEEGPVDVRVSAYVSPEDPSVGIALPEVEDIEIESMDGKVADEYDLSEADVDGIVEKARCLYRERRNAEIALSRAPADLDVSFEDLFDPKC